MSFNAYARQFVLSLIVLSTLAWTAKAQTVVIDPGHGGTERVNGSSPNNAKGPKGTLEKDLTLDVALKTAEVLREQGIEVIMTRDKDVNLGLADRALVAKNAKADAFLSIHFNGWKTPDVQGTETFRHENASDDSNSEQLAKRVLAAVLKVTGYKNRGVKTARFGVLNPQHHDDKTAACLLEISFMTDPKDEARLADEKYRQQLAEAIAGAVAEHVKK
ncbi:N-acetylmuramoyl-L-alanine amidase [Blastopirellula marina]|nr:N-acetylmuramoyl-L-alanine amidase [Blastopirellula marina]